LGNKSHLIWNDTPFFTSTSLSLKTALTFARFDEIRQNGRIPALLVIQTDQGAAISGYLPENIHEYEVLIAPNTQFKFVKKILNHERNKAIIFLRVVTKGSGK